MADEEFKEFSARSAEVLKKAKEAQRRISSLSLKLALSDAIKEIEEHNKEYHYRTSTEKIEKWKALLK